jgi:micrococcal nuclease
MIKSFKTISLLFTLLLLIPTLSLAAQHKVIRVVDGDTIVVDYKGKYEKVRLQCINTPESVHQDKKQNIPMGKVASEFIRESLEGKYIDLEFEGPFRGRYLSSVCLL